MRLPVDRPQAQEQGGVQRGKLYCERLVENADSKANQQPVRVEEGGPVTNAPKAATISIPETLSLLDNDFRTFADAVAAGRYAFWLGSGISFDRFPGLKSLVVKVLEYLRTSGDFTNQDCPFRAAMNRALGIANLTPDECAAIDFAKPVEQWEAVDLLKDRLSGQYASFLNIDVDGEDLDILVWEGVDVAGTYGDEAVAPDAEHFCIAVLVKEGLVSEIPSANWDGLVEKAMAMLNDGVCALKVCVRSEDLQAADQKATLVKFHGCAVRAREDEATYRPYIVGAQRQIDAWRDDQKMQGLVQHLTSVAIEKPTLLLGFSAQDGNIRNLFSLASNAQNWEWPGDFPAYVMAEEAIGEAQSALLGNVYKEQFDGVDRAEIKKSAHLRAFAKPLLLALVLWVYGAKLQRLSRLGPFDLIQEMANWVDEGIVLLRDEIASSNCGAHAEFADQLITQVSRAKRLFLCGDDPKDETRYEPVTPIPVTQMTPGVEWETGGAPEAAVAAAIIGHGAGAGDWTLVAADPSDDKSGIVAIKKGERSDRIFVLASPQAEVELFQSGRVDDGDDDAVLIHAQPLYERMQRTPKSAPGRTGEVVPRRVSVRHLVSTAAAPDELMEAFKLEAGL